jgi:tetratricopeptide (TPR) repeat protein
MKKCFIFLIVLVLLSCAGLKKASEFYQNEDYELAIKECQEAIAQDSLNAKAYLIMGKSFKALGEKDDAMASLEKASQVQPYSDVTVSAKNEIVTIKLENASEFLDQKRYNQAISTYFEIIELDSTNFDAYYKLGDSYNQNGLLDKAKFYYQKANQIRMQNQPLTNKIQVVDSLSQVAEANFQKGYKYYIANNNKLAVKYVKLALEAKADHQDAKYYLHIAQGKILYRKGSKSACWDAIEQYGKAMMIRPESAEPHFFLAQAYERKDRNEFTNAIEEYSVALEKEPNGPYAAKSKQKVNELKALRDKLKKFWGK